MGFLKNIFSGCVRSADGPDQPLYLGYRAVISILGAFGASNWTFQFNEEGCDVSAVLSGKQIRFLVWAHEATTKPPFEMLFVQHPFLTKDFVVLVHTYAASVHQKHPPTQGEVLRTLQIACDKMLN